MTGPYRESDTAAIDCPRCGRTMPPGAIAACAWGCGVWVNSEAAGDAFVATELAKSRVTHWFRKLAPCPHCSTMMTLRGYDMSLFQGCDEHGVWVDDETVGQTGLGRAAIAPQVQRAREVAKARRVEHEAREAEERAAREAEERNRDADWEAMERGMRAAAEEERARARAAAAEAERQRLERIRQARLQKLTAMVKSLEFEPEAFAEYLLQLEEKIAALQDRF
jgi:hypothetical protein